MRIFGPWHQDSDHHCQNGRYGHQIEVYAKGDKRESWADGLENERKQSLPRRTLGLIVGGLTTTFLTKIGPSTDLHFAS